MNQFSPILPYFRNHPRKLAAGLTCVAGSVCLALAVPLLVGRAIDQLRRQADSETLLAFAGALVGITIVQGIITFGQRIILVSLSRDIEFELRNDYFAHLERLPLSFYQQSYTGDLMARATNDLQAVRMLCGPAIMYSANTILTASGALFFMSRIHFKLTLLALLSLPLVAVVTKVVGQRIHELFQKVQEQFSTLSTRVQENLAGARVVRAYSQEESEASFFGELNDEFVKRNRRLIRWTAAFHPLLQGLVGIGFVLVLWYGGQLVRSGAITVGEFVSFNFFLSKLVWPMIAIGWVINLAQRGSVSLQRIQEIIRTEPAIRDDQGAIELGNISGAVQFKELSFAFEEGGTSVLEGIDFEVEAGQTVAIVGRTGAGKSTLLSMVPRQVNPPRGALFVDGRDVRSLSLSSLRQAIAAVPQETFLFSMTVRENIALGKPDASLDEIFEAARTAGLETDLASMSDGLDTVVGERGIMLSGGQKQRLALARAVLRRPRILLLDDCLSAVDTHTENEILGNLKSVFSGRTVFIVSHRVSAVQDADLILVLDNGKICERGSHAALVASRGQYADLYRRQQLEEELEAV
jgi:ATP-binding cassette subfamily B protein